MAVYLRYRPSLWLSDPHRRATYSQSRDESLSLTPLNNDRSQLVCSLLQNHRGAHVNDTHKSTHKTTTSPTHTINPNMCTVHVYVPSTCRLIYKPPPLVFLSLSELRRSCLIPAWFIWIWIFYTSAQRPESNYSWTKTFPELSHIIPPSATASGQSN